MTMRYGWWLLWVLVPMFTAHAQDRPGMVSLSEVMLAERGAVDLAEVLWRFQEGDNEVWADPGFDDGGWDLVDTDFQPDTLHEVWQGIGWFRLRLSVDSALQQTTLGLQTYHLGASEIYLNGERVGAFGRIGANAEQDQAFIPKGLPLSLHLDDRSEHVLAVRYSNRMLASRTILQFRERQFLTPGFALVIGPNRSMIQGYVFEGMKIYIDALIMGVLLLILCLHLLLYGFDRRERANLFYALAVTCLCIAHFAGHVVGYRVMVVDGRVNLPSLDSLGGHGFFGFSLFLLATLYQLYAPHLLRYLRWGVVTWVVLTMGLLLMPISIMGHSFAVVLFLGYPVMVEAVRVASLAVYRRQEGARLLGGAVVFTLVVMLYALAQPTIFEGPWTPRTFIQEDSHLLTPIGMWLMLFYFPLPLAMSTLLARRFVQRSRRLESELERVEELSEQTLAQEREKQELIATQNERLEAEVAERTVELESAYREAQVEGALERVRSRTMAMQESVELGAVIQIVFQEALRLGFGAQACDLVIVDGETGGSEFWISGERDAPGEVIHIHLPRLDHAHYVDALNAWSQKTKTRQTVLKGAACKAYMAQVTENVIGGTFPEDVKSFVQELSHVHHADAYMRYGYFRVASQAALDERALAILERFARVFEQTYTRFLDLKKAEEQAREAQVEVALERVRSRALAMHASSELKDVATELRRQMALLGQKELEVCMIHLYDDAETFASWGAIRPPGQAGELVAFHARLPRSVVIMEDVLERYRSDVMDYVVVNEGAKALEWMHVLKEHVPFVYDMIRPIVEAPEARPLRAYWAFSDFSGGSLGMVTYQPPSEEAVDMLRRCARVFDLAYRRFRDLKQAEVDHQALVEEKALTEQALAELRATQAQLIHAEKMASLGQLTAGIAHEIKNPLNFINNFAEVNEELADELREDLADHPEAFAAIEDLIADLKQNAAVIAQHGKRADGIVRSMMAHARSGSGERTPTDLNALVHEHVDLAYHGKRATYPGFTVTIERDLDEQVGEVLVVPQDIGRVILNLLSNAFDVLEGRADAYVRVTTQQVGEQVELRVSDNGPGMSEAVQAKVFEPFFTTKPTGQGTGLGLSLSYDIITQGHGGTMTVESEMGKGALFVVVLPTQGETG